MASRWFVFWIALFILSEIKGDGNWWIWLLFAALTGDPAQAIINKIKGLDK